MSEEHEKQVYLLEDEIATLKEVIADRTRDIEYYDKQVITLKERLDEMKSRFDNFDITENESLKLRIAGLEDALLDTTLQGCHETDGVIDSSALSAYENAFRVLEKSGHVKIVVKGRMFAEIVDKSKEQ